MRLEDLVPLYTVEQLNDPELAQHEHVFDQRNHLSPPPLYESDDGDMCDDCPYCLDVCGDELRRDEA